MSSTLFALDIGTRSVVGIILKQKEDSYHVADLISIEHKERSMIDGQIHNILSVAHVITEIKERLEKKHGPLKQVSVAAAGRALKTTEGSMTVDISARPLISNEDVNRLELGAVQKAQQQLLSAESMAKNDHYYCVGYSVLHQKLDGEKIGNLIEQSGHTATVEVIATFLPQVVVESLLSALTRAGLEMEALTLEPIAAIQVLIPPSMRRLNVALVDIGAGTSDIAITDNSTIIAYGMVPLAGDEITEALSSEYLLDFPVAEKVKRSLENSEDVEIEDILGFTQRIPSDDVNQAVRPTVQRLARSISDEIRRLNNGKSPQAVILVGGGSLTPHLPKELSTFLDLPKTRVGIRGLEALSDITTETDFGTSPDLVTPIGIAIAARRAPIHYMSVIVNDKAVRLFELKEMTVADALLASSISARHLYGKPGHGMKITVNGNDITIPGEHGTPSTLMLNGKVASSKDYIANGDIIELILGKDGSDASVTARHLFEDIEPVHVTIDGKSIVLEPEVIINGKLQSLDTVVQDRDQIVMTHDKTLIGALHKLGWSDLLKEEAFTVYVDAKPLTFKHNHPIFKVQNTVIRPAFLLQNSDVITIEKNSPLTVADVVRKAGKQPVEQINVLFNDKDVVIRKNRCSIKINDEAVTLSTIVQPNDQVTIKTITKEPIIFSDIFAFTDYTLPKITTGSYQLLRNGVPIGFNDPIFDGDHLQIVFSH